MCGPALYRKGFRLIGVISVSKFVYDYEHELPEKRDRRIHELIQFEVRLECSL